MKANMMLNTQLNIYGTLFYTEKSRIIIKRIDTETTPSNGDMVRNISTKA